MRFSAYVGLTPLRLKLWMYAMPLTLTKSTNGRVSLTIQKRKKPHFKEETLEDDIAMGLSLTIFNVGRRRKY
jgi:hypothetical protein